jgi:hypothetical protein
MASMLPAVGLNSVHTLAAFTIGSTLCLMSYGLPQSQMDLMNDITTVVTKRFEDLCEIFSVQNLLAYCDPENINFNLTLCEELKETLINASQIIVSFAQKIKV